MDLSFYGLAGFPMVEPGDDLAQFIIDAIRDNKRQLQDGDVIVIAQKDLATTRTAGGTTILNLLKLRIRL